MGERDEHGRWIAGHKSTGGRKSRIDEEEAKQLFDKAFPRKRKLAILEKVATLAERGDMVAIKLCLEYLFGKPIDKVEHTGEDGGPIEILVTYEDKPPITETP